MRNLIFAGIGAAAAYATMRWQFRRWFTEEPRFELEAKMPGLEIRRYEPYVRAETSVNAHTWQDALKVGLHRLARYILGNNEPMAQLAMATPITTAIDARESWRIAFTMPRLTARKGYPSPSDSNVALRIMPARRVAVLRFAGARSASLVGRKTRELREKLKEAGFEPKGDAEYAGYDAPTTLSIFRRNEVWMEIED